MTLPEILPPSLEMSEPNEIIRIYEGIYFLKNKKSEVHILGKIQFEWFPISRAYFSGAVQSKSSFDEESGDDDYIYQLVVNDINCGECFITNTVSSNSETIVRGTFSYHIVLGDKTIPVDCMKFSIPNLRPFRGMPVNKVYANGHATIFGRLTFDADDYKITVDQVHNYNNLNKILADKGGYIILYGGEIRKKKGGVSLDKINELTHCFNTFLSFLNGRRTSLLFLQGIYDNREIWTDFTYHHVDQYKGIMSWPPQLSIDGLSELWVKFYSIWKNVDDRDFLIFAVNWYIEANSEISERSFILAQTALELIYNWLIVEKRRLLIGKDADSISAANKIRLLIAQLKISGDIPLSFNEAQSYVSNNNDIVDGPDAFVQIRNAIVHAQEDKRRKLSTINHNVKHQVLDISMWYIELSLLYLLDYKGEYHNRCSGSGFIMHAEQKVPWA
jgi:hypothetical protein